MLIVARIHPKGRYVDRQWREYIQRDVMIDSGANKYKPTGKHLLKTIVRWWKRLIFKVRNSPSLILKSDPDLIRVLYTINDTISVR